MIDDYFQEIASIIKEESCIEGSSAEYDKRTPFIGFLKGSLYFSDGSVLHFREYVNVRESAIERYMYVYQYHDLNGFLLFRYDNTPHFRHLPTFPHHKHDGSESNVIGSPLPTLKMVLDEIRLLLNVKL